MADEQKGRVVGHGPCPNCGHTAAYKLNKKEHLYVYCDVEGNGGCNSGTQSRSHKGDVSLAKRITKWANTADRARLLGEAEKPAEEGKVSVWDRRIF